LGQLVRGERPHDVLDSRWAEEREQDAADDFQHAVSGL
jgi:hypothetical protein